MSPERADLSPLGNDIESMLPGALDTVRFDTPKIDTLLSNLRFVAELLSEAPMPFAGPALIFRTRDNAVRTVPIGASLRFGRSHENHISFPDLREVSRHHFTISVHGDEFVLTDANSANGTFIRGNPARIQTHHLRDGDVVEAAGILFAFIRS